MKCAASAQLQEAQLQDKQLDQWLANGELATADAWLERKRRELEPNNWCALLSELAQRLAFTDRHAQAEEWLRTGVRQYPDNSELLINLAEVLQVQGRARDAIALLRRAIAVADDDNERCFTLWLRLSTIALPANPTLAKVAVEQARDALTRSTQASDSQAPEQTPEERNQAHGGERTLRLELALADCEARSDQPHDAEARYRRILEHQPQWLGALQGLGQLMLQLGRIDEAITLFERLKTADAGRGYGSLMRVRRFPDDVETLHQLERAARTPGFEGSVRTGLLFQLAAAWENRGCYEQAWALADEANTAARRMLNYDAERHRQRCARIRHAFPAALYQQREDSGVTSTLPVFVVGMPRSGTTLVEQIIAGHSAIHGAGELGAIPQVIAGLERWERRTGSGRHYPDCVDDLDPTVLRGIAERTLEDLKAFATDASKVRHVVDKLPHNFENIGLIRLLFPNAKIISVRRDPRDIAISNYLMDYAAKHSGMGFAYDLDWIGEQLADHNLLMQHWHRVCPGEILEINYEDLIDSPEPSARRLLAHIGVGWEPQVLDFHDLERSVKTASVWQVRQPLYASSKSRWRRYSNRLQPLIAATNRRIRFQPIEMITLPEPGWLNTGVDLFRRGDLDDAEYRFKQLLQHVPDHAAALYMLGLVYLQKGASAEGVKLLEDALQRCPWNRHWRADLARAYELTSRHDDARALAVDTAVQPANAKSVGLDYLYFSEESACASSGPSNASG